MDAIIQYQKEFSLVHKITDYVTMGNIYLGPEEYADDIKWLKENNIKYILNLSSSKSTHIDNIKYLTINALDQDDYLIAKHFDECREFINDALTYSNILVYCQAGVSRSATIVIMYLMYEEKMTLKDAYNLVISKRPVIKPNKGFMMQLEELDLQLNNNIN